MKYTTCIVLLFLLACTRKNTCPTILFDEVKKIKSDIIFFDSLNVTKANAQFYYIKALDSLASLGNMIQDSLLYISIWPDAGYVKKQLGYKIIMGKKYRNLIQITDYNVIDTLFPYMHYSNTVVKKLYPKHGWGKFINTIVCEEDIIGYFNKPYVQGGADGLSIILQIRYAGRTLSNEFSLTDTSKVTQNLLDLVKFIQKETK